MNYVRIDLHKRFPVVVAEDDRGWARRPRRFGCQDAEGIRSFFESPRPFRAVIEASSSHRWLYELLEPLGSVTLAHPLRLRAIVSGRAKTDELDAAPLAKLLRGGLIPPPTFHLAPTTSSERAREHEPTSRLSSRRWKRSPTSTGPGCTAPFSSWERLESRDDFERGAWSGRTPGRAAADRQKAG